MGRLGSALRLQRVIADVVEALVLAVLFLLAFA